MIQLVVLSGKGGTGKTSVTAALADLASRDNPEPWSLVLVDADVDASNLELILSPQRITTGTFQGGAQAEINLQLCQGCGTCKNVCRFDAVQQENGNFVIDHFACEGCGACVFQCPEEAISLVRQTAGEWYCSNTELGPLFHAELFAGQENSGKLVARVKEEARKMEEQNGSDLMLVDGPPGVGCPVISAVSGADFALIVAEPSLSGIHDLRRILQTTAYLGVETSVCVNKVDLSQTGFNMIRKICQEFSVPILGEIPFDLHLPEAMVAGLPVTAAAPESPAAIAIADLWGRIKMMDKGDGQEGKPEKRILLKH